MVCDGMEPLSGKAYVGEVGSKQRDLYMGDDMEDLTDLLTVFLRYQN